MLTAEQKKFVRENCQGKSNVELTALLNKIFHTITTPAEVRSYKNNHHITSGLDSKFKKGHQPMCKGKKWNEFMSEIGQKNALKTAFKKGSIPVNHRIVGSERINVDGYVEIKVAEPNKWRLKHRVEYERINGAVPRNKAVIFKDQNKLNFAADNLVLVSRSELLVINKKNFLTSNKELSESGIACARLIDKLNHLTKKERNNEE